MTGTTFQKLKNISTIQFLAITLAVGAILRLINITKSSLWHDEGYTMMMLSFSPAEILHRTGLDVHPPLYYLIAKYWVGIFGTSELAVRSLSVVFGLGVIVFTYLLIRRLFGDQTARLAAIFTALGPFLVRYSQEARMYGLLALIAAASTYMLVRALQTKKTLDWVIYGGLISLGLYTYYYVIFLIAFHWAYIIFLAIYPKLSMTQMKKVLFSPQWIGANVVAMGLFLPWLPTAIKQFLSVQTAFWIPKVTGDTLAVTFSQFLTFTDMNILQIGTTSSLLPSIGGRTFLFIVFIIMIASLAFSLRRKHLPGAILLVLYLSLTPVAVFFMSLIKNPIYVDRYFVFASSAFYALLAVIMHYGWPWFKSPRARSVVTIIICLTLLFGVKSVYDQAGHRMSVVASQIQADFTPGDELINGDFYTYFDYRYYNKTESPNKVFVPDSFPGCCEGKSMLYDKPELLVRNLNDIHPSSGYVWIIGKTGPQDYFDSRIPAHWTPVGPKYEAGYSAAQKYRVNPRPTS